jgi:hypothetical protein
MKILGTIILCGALFVMAFTGCGTTSKEIQAKSQSERPDVFIETKAGKQTPKGFAVLLLRACIKTPLEGYYIMESNRSLHGKPGYSFLVNIDGQATMWKVDGFKDSKPEYDTDDKTSRDPEAGEGMKYVMEKRLRLHAGQHRIFLGLPEENYSITTDIMLKDGQQALLEYKPIYRHKRLPVWTPSFLKGIDKYEVFLNGKQL